MSSFFTSDIHFRHKNILKFENRPFNTLVDMNSGMINAWNNKVGRHDTVYYLGDFCFGNYDEWAEILNQLNGNIVFIKGNHDNSTIIKQLYANGYFKELHMVGHYMKVNKNILHLTHYPMQIGNRPRMFSIHGHIHNHNSKELNQINVCVDSPLNFNRNFGEPIPLEELIRHMEIRNPLVEEQFHIERENR